MIGHCANPKSRKEVIQINALIMMPTLGGDLVSSSVNLPVSAQSSLSAENLPPDAFVALLLAQLSGESGANGTSLGAAMATLASSAAGDGAASADTPADADGAAATAQHGADSQPLLVDTAALLALMGLQQVADVPATGDPSVEGDATAAAGAVEAVSASATLANSVMVPLVAGPSSVAAAVPSGTQAVAVDGKLVPAVASAAPDGTPPVTAEGKLSPPVANAAVDAAMEQAAMPQTTPSQAAASIPAVGVAELGAQGTVAQAAEPASVAAAAVVADGVQTGKPGRPARVAALPASAPARTQSVLAGADAASTVHTAPAERPGAQNSLPQANVPAFDAIVSGTGGAAQPSAPAEKHDAHEPSPLPAMATSAKAAVPAKPAAAPVQEPAASFWRELARPITNQTAAGVRMALAQSGKEAHIRLQPESLGHLDIRVVLDGSNVQVHVMAEHAEVGQVIASHWTQLRETLATQGLQATNLAVSVGLGGNPRELAGRNARHDGWRRDREEMTGIQDEGLDVTQSRPTLSTSRHFLDGGRIEYWG